MLTPMSNNLGLVYGTPVETHTLADGRVNKVKRDDLAGTYPAPPLGKLRGIALQCLGTKSAVIGVVDRSPNSRNSWAFAYCCKALGKRCVAYGRRIGQYQEEAIKLGAEYRIEEAGGSPEDLYHWATVAFRKEVGGNAYMPEDNCQAEPLVNDAKQEVLRTGYAGMLCENLVIPTGSGGLAAGVLLGLFELQILPNLICLHIGGSRRKPDYIRQKLVNLGVHPMYITRLRFVVESPPTPKDQELPPFPANPTYEAPAWAWVGANPLEGETLFWNAGA